MVDGGLECSTVFVPHEEGDGGDVPDFTGIFLAVEFQVVKVLFE